MKKTGWLVLLGLQLLIIVGFWFYNHVNHPLGNQLTGESVGQFLAYGRLTGLLAVFGILFQLILIRIKWLERFFGFDRLTNLHHFVGFSIIILLLAHPVLLIVGNSIQTDVSYLEQFKDFCLNWDDVLSAVIGFAIMLIAIAPSFLVLKKWLKYESWYFSHLTFYIAIVLAFGHLLSVGSDFTGNSYFEAYWYLLYAFTFGNLIYYRFIRPIMLFYRHRFTITRLVTETPDVTSLYIEGRKMESFRVEAGQFIIIRFWAKAFRWEAHPFSMSCKPDGTHIRFSIKAVGDFTKRLPQVKVGTKVIIDGPHGVLTSKNSKSSKCLLIAGGIGITPICSLSEEMSSMGRDVVLIYANRNRAAIVFENEFKELEKTFSDHFKVFHILSDEPSWTGEKGRLDKEKITRLVPDYNDREVFLCGPPTMMKSVRSILSELNIPKTRIHFEKFSL